MICIKEDSNFAGPLQTMYISVMFFQKIWPAAIVAAFWACSNSNAPEEADRPGIPDIEFKVMGEDRHFVFKQVRPYIL